MQPTMGRPTRSVSCVVEAMQAVERGVTAVLEAAGTRS